MSFFRLLGAIAKKRLTPEQPKPVRTKVPLRLSQSSAVEISIVPMVLAENAGALFGSNLAERHTIVAVGQFSLFGIDITRAYLSQDPGAYLHFATHGSAIVESRLYRPYDEVIPATGEEWAFWLDQADGYIGYPIMQSKDDDGQQQYSRSWSPGETRINPFEVIEKITDAVGNTTVVQHQMMHYSRAMAGDVPEHLLVSAAATADGMSVNLWLGINLVPHDLTIFPSLDAPQ